MKWMIQTRLYRGRLKINKLAKLAWDLNNTVYIEDIFLLYKEMYFEKHGANNPRQ